MTWRNFLQEEDLDATIVKKIIIEHEEKEEPESSILSSKNNFSWGPIIVVILIVVGVVLFTNLKAEKEPRQDPSGTYKGYDSGISYEFTFLKNPNEKTVGIVEYPNCYYTGHWRTKSNGDIIIYDLNNYDNCYNQSLLEGTYEVCDKPECTIDGKYYHYFYYI